MQDNKNLILAVVLCLIVLFGWGYVAEYMGWAPKPQMPAQESEKTVAPQKQSLPVQERQFLFLPLRRDAIFPLTLLSTTLFSTLAAVRFVPLF